MATIFQDNFDRADGDLGPWDDNYGNWTVASNRLVCPPLNGDLRHNWATEASAPQTQHVRVRVKEYGLATTAGGPLARAVEGFNRFYYVNCFTDGGGDHIYLLKWVDGTATEIAHVDGITRTEGGEITLECGDGAANPNVQKVYYNGVLLITAADTTFPNAGRVGMSSYFQPGFTNTWDDFVMEDVPTGPDTTREVSGTTRGTGASASTGTLTVTDLPGAHAVSGTTSGAGAPTRVTLAAGTTSYADAGLEPGRTYYYRIKAVGDGGDSDWSETATATTTGG